MLPTRNRLLASHSFEKIKKQGKLFQSKNFGVCVLNRKDQDPIRFGFVISTKVSKLAFQRNRIKRAMGEAARQYLTRLKNGYDVVFLAKKTIERVSTEDIMHEVETFIGGSELKK